MTETAIGILKSKKKVFCEICGSSYNRNLKVSIYEHTENAIEKAKLKLTKKATAEYICKICKSIKN